MKRLLALLLLCVPLAAPAAVTILGVPANRDLLLASGYTVETGADVVVWAVSAKGTGALDVNNITVTGGISGTATLSGGTVRIAKKQIADLANDIVSVVFYVLAADLPSGGLTASMTWTGTLGSTQLLAKVFSLDATSTPIQLDVTTGVSQTAATDPFTGSFTVAANSTQIAVGGFTTSSINSAPGSGWTEQRDVSAPGNGGMRHVVESKVSTTGGSTTWTFDLSVADTGSVAVASFKDTVSAGPVFTVAPNVTARSTSSLTIGFTTDIIATVYGVRVVNGSGAPTCTQVKAGQNSIGGAALQNWSEVTAAGVSDSHAFSSITNGTVSDAYFCPSAAGGDGTVAGLANLYKTPAFTVAPTVTATSAVGYTQSFTCDGPGTVYTVATVKGSTTPTATQVSNAQNGSGAAALGSANKAVTTSADTVVLTGLTVPIQDLHTICNYGSFNSAVTSLTSQLKQPPAGYQYSAALASVSGTSFCASLSSPAVAAGDIVQISSVTDPSGDAVSILNTCDVTFSSNGSRQKLLYQIYDDSAGGLMVGGPGALWVNNLPPFVQDPSETLIFVLPVNVAITPVDLSGACDDPEGDAITVTAIGTLPAGLTVSSNTLSGTPTVRGAFRGVTFRCTDITGDFFDWQ